MDEEKRCKFCKQPIERCNSECGGLNLKYPHTFHHKKNWEHYCPIETSQIREVVVEPEDLNTIELENVMEDLDITRLRQNLELKGKTARIRFVELKNGKVGFYAESYKTKESVSIGLTKEDVENLLAFLHTLKGVVSSEVA